jgi:hypothetical protein
MEWARSHRSRFLAVQRACERSRVQDQLMVAAYELAAPLVRRRLPAPEAERVTCSAHQETNQLHVALGGMSA